MSDDDKQLLAPPRWRCRWCSRYFWGDHLTVCLCCGRSNGWKSAIKRGIIWNGKPEMGDWPSREDLHPWEPGPEQTRQSVRVYRCHRLIIGVGMCTWQHAQFGEEPNERCNVHPEDPPKFVGWIDRKWWEARFDKSDVTQEVRTDIEMRAKANKALPRIPSEGATLEEVRGWLGHPNANWTTIEKDIRAGAKALTYLDDVETAAAYGNTEARAELEQRPKK